MASQGWPLYDTITLLLNLPFLLLHDFQWGKSHWKQQLFYKYYSPGSISQDFPLSAGYIE